MENFSLPHTGKRLYRLAVGSFFFVQGLIFSSWASRIPDIKQIHDLNEAELGGVLFAMPVGQMLCMVLAAWLVSHLGSRRGLILGAASYSACLVSLGFAPNTVWLCACLVLFGMASNLCNIAVNTQAVGVERIYHRSIMAAFHGLWSLAGLTGGVAGALLAGFGVSVGVHFVIIFSVCVLGILLMNKSLLPRDHREAATSTASVPSAPGWIERLRGTDPTVLMLGLVAFGCMAAEGTMFDWSSVYYEEVIRPEPQLIRLGYIAYMTTMVTGRFLADRLVTRFGVIMVLRASGLLIAAGLLLAVLIPTVPVATFGLTLVGFGTSGVVPICYSLSGKTRRMHPGVAVTVVSSIGFVGFLLCPPVIGLIAQATSLRVSFAVIAAVGLMTTVMAGRLR